MELSETHRALLVQEEQTQRELAQMYQETQDDSKDNSEMMEWSRRLTLLLEEKEQGLTRLKVRSVTYQQHLKEH